MSSVVVLMEFRGGIGGTTSIGHDDGLTLERYRSSIDKAFSIDNLKAFCLVINSPGGSPVQSHLLAEYIRQYGDSTGVPIYAFVEDMACSGGYLLAAAADTIFVSVFSAVGSIGVTTTTFKVSTLLESIGIEAKTYTSGERKGGAFNHFSATSKDDEEDLNHMLKTMHKEFIKWVYTRREGKLDSEQTEQIFSGAVFTGVEAIELGLADHLYTVKEQTIREAIGTDRAKIVNLAPSGGSSMAIRLRNLVAKSSGFSSILERIRVPEITVWSCLALLVMLPILFVMAVTISMLTALFILLALTILIPLKLFYLCFIFPCIWLTQFCCGDDSDYNGENYRRDNFKRKRHTTVVSV